MFNKRITRLGLRASISVNDLKRSLSWHVRWKKHYQQNWQKIAAKYQWCFIVGCNNSGTTLMQDLLEQTLPVSTMPHEGQRYTNVLQRGSRRSHERVWTEFIDDLQMSEHDSFSCAPRLLHDWMSEYRSPRETILIEKTTVNAVRMRWLQQVFPNSYFIGMVRNGYAVAEGIHRKGNKDYVRGSKHWAKVNETMLEDSKYVSNFMVMKYEDLVSEPYLALEKLVKFLGFENAVLKSEGNLASILTGIQNMNPESTNRINEDESKIIEENALNMLNYFNYTIKQ